MTGTRGIGWLRWIAHRRAARRRHQLRRGRFGARAAAGGNPTQGISLLILSLPGLAALAALLFTWMQVSQTGKELRISEQGQITSRFNAAIGNLGSTSVDVRLGGIYALERIMHDSARDQPTVVSVLSAYVRRRAPLPTGTKSTEGPPPAEIDAVMNVLAGRRPEYDKGLSINLSHTDLSGWTPWYAHGERGISLVGADLTGTDLSDTNFSDAQLRGVYLSEANLRGADLNGADLSGADLGMTNLREASFLDANLSDASFCGYSDPVQCADLTDVMFDNANLTGAVLASADLTKATLCSGNFFIDIRTGRKRGGHCARLRDADLANANLSKVDLSGVDLNGADLSKANLSKANLTGADLTGAKLDGARLDGVRGLPPSLRRAP
ncbi:pentapeptide repeat-containing protein [Streptomyces sp. NBC_01296]|uniref:pentapeptide repeat-containing protein n=1 Tax=Streptomyces sp. NBC_01296 TaxID=2903816 RepID=UPI002E1073B2|nr:pentapeptide repeat-containing protein [Streptomyces sp. NBC_01296]